MDNENKLFDPNLVYPSDDHGHFIETNGEVIEAEKLPDDYSGKGLLKEHIGISVKTNEGVYYVFSLFPVQIGDNVGIRLYAWGGGNYPDNKVMSAEYKTKKQV